ncbi:MAG: extensin-like domain-containing protein [Paracoccaceae bacterium]
MKHPVRYAILGLALLAGPSCAEAPESSARPTLRDMLSLNIPPPAAVLESLRPAPRTDGVEGAARSLAAQRLAGSVCGDPAIQGERIGNVPGPGACGIEDAVRVTHVSGVALSPSARMDCQTAQALKTWADRGNAVTGGMDSLRVVAGYHCRARRGTREANPRLSEHSFGHAIDIAAITLEDGRRMTLTEDWGRGDAGRMLRELWRAACGPFGTVLGPEANAAHRDHFHFDTARYRSGSYCR